jgi:hypothetical protein
VRQAPGIFGIFDVPDIKTLFIGVVPRRSMQRRGSGAQACDHHPIGNLQLECRLARLIRTWNKFHVSGLRRFRHIHDRPARIPEMGQIEIIPPTDFLHCHLKARFPVQIMAGQKFHVLDITLIHSHVTFYLNPVRSHVKCIVFF